MLLEMARGLASRSQGSMQFGWASQMEVPSAAAHIAELEACLVREQHTSAALRAQVGVETSLCMVAYFAHSIQRDLVDSVASIGHDGMNLYEDVYVCARYNWTVYVGRWLFFNQNQRRTAQSTAVRRMKSPRRTVQQCKLHKHR